MGKRGTEKLKGFNAATWIFAMKNKLVWRDQNDITTNGENINLIKKMIQLKLVCRCG